MAQMGLREVAVEAAEETAQRAVLVSTTVMQAVI